MNRLLTLALLCLTCSCAGSRHELRILTCGIRHESNTFSSQPTTAEDFTLYRGEEAIRNVPWADTLLTAGVDLIPILHAYAWPGGVVEKSAFESMQNEILDGIRKAGRLDGIYLDLHGALHVDGYDDPQATFVRKIREIVGDDVVIAASFDAHGNVSKELYEQLNLLTGFRTVPHRDGMETKVRAVKMLLKTLKEKLKPQITCVEIPILVPGEKSITEVEPLKSIYEQIVPNTEKEGIMDVSILAGYAWADLPRSAMRVFVVADDKKYQPQAREIACDLAQQIWDCRDRLELDVPSGSIEEMLDLAKQYPGKTVFISDSGDNTTAGAPGDNPQVAAAFINRKIKNALVTAIVDPASLQQCVEAGAGNRVELSLGGKKDTQFGKPLQIQGKVVFVSPEEILKTDRAAAVIDVDGVKIVIVNTRRSFTTLNDFREINEDPLSYDIVVVKLGYLYPELRDIAPVHLMALTSGYCNLTIESLPFKHLDGPAYPLDKEMEWCPIPD